MALQMATNITPDSLNGIGGGVFDASSGLNVSWQVNGASPMLAYQIVLYENDAESTQLHTTGKVTLSAPFYGTMWNGKTQMFHATEISAATLATAGLENGNEYKMVITQWWGATDEESVTQSSAAVIQAYSPPSVTMGAISSPLNSRNGTFTATFSQAEGDTVSWVRWRIALSTSTADPLMDTGRIYGTSELKAEYDAFFTGNVYAVRCDVGTLYGQEATTGWITFSVSYPVTPPNGLVEACCRSTDGAVLVNWSTARSTIGEATGDYTLTGGGLKLAQNASVSWSESNGETMSYAAPWTLFWKGIPVKRNGGDLFEIETDGGTITARMTASGGDVTATMYLDGTSIGSATGAGVLTQVWTLVMNDDTLYAMCYTGTDGLYPSDTLYPSNTLYPRDESTFTTSTYTGSVTYTQQTITSIRVIGEQTCEWMWVDGESMSAAEIATILADAMYEPVWTEETLFQTDFANGLNAGNLNTTGYALYRQDVSTGVYEKIAEPELNALALADYSAKNNHTYIYQLWYTDATTFVSQPVFSEAVTPFTWNYVLLACTQDEATGVYTVAKKYIVSCNIDTGDISNNNQPKVQKSFTRYPSWQADTALYKTGTLKAYIGSVDPLTNLYSDTQAYADEIQALSTSEYTLFLKDRKGSLLMIRPSNSIVMRVEDKHPTQTVTMQFPWVEIGDTEGVSIIVAATDAEWPDDMVSETTVEIDPATGLLSWTTPDEYSITKNGSGLSVTEAGMLVQTSDVWYKPDTLSITSAQNLTATIPDAGDA